MSKKFIPPTSAMPQVVKATSWNNEVSLEALPVLGWKFHREREEYHPVTTEGEIDPTPTEAEIDPFTRISPDHVLIYVMPPSQDHRVATICTRVVIQGQRRYFPDMDATREYLIKFFRARDVARQRLLQFQRGEQLRQHKRQMENERSERLIMEGNVKRRVGEDGYERTDKPTPEEEAGFNGPPADVVAEGLNRIRRADPSFDPAPFIDRAHTAFEMIVAAFAKGDKPGLRPLLSDEIFQRFAMAIDERLAAKETLETHIERLDSVDIVEAGLAGRTAQVTLKLVSHQINVTRAMDASIVDGSPGQAAEKTDYWTFARDTRSTDPNWILVATSSG